MCHCIWLKTFFFEHTATYTYRTLSSTTLQLLGLVHTSDGIGSAMSVTIQCKSKIGIGIGVKRIRTVSFSSDSASASVASVVPIHTRSELSSDSDSAYDSISVPSVASVNQPLVSYLLLTVVYLLTCSTDIQQRGIYLLITCTCTIQTWYDFLSLALLHN